MLDRAHLMLYIALGGLACATSKEIIAILTGIRPHLAENTRLQLFRVSSINAIPVFHHLEVASFESASPLRRAWLGSGAKYHMMSGKMYTATRISLVDRRRLEVKRLLEVQVSNRDTLKQIE